MNEVDKEAQNCRLQQFQGFRRSEKQRVPAKVIEVFTLTAELVEEPTASAPIENEIDAANVGATVADALKMAL